jgi:Amidohydrolase family
VERAERTIDASGLLVLPGGVDVHTHLDAPGAYGSTADDFASGTVAAACGGTTTIVDFCQQQKGQTVTDALRVWHEKAAGSAAVDYGFHIIVVDVTDNVLKELAALPQEGVSSFKLFMAYKGAQGGRCRDDTCAESCARQPRARDGAFRERRRDRLPAGKAIFRGQDRASSPRGIASAAVSNPRRRLVRSHWLRRWARPSTLCMSLALNPWRR